jgi:cytochrome c-type biogenesis protein CcmH/NrfG
MAAKAYWGVSEMVDISTEPERTKWSSTQVYGTAAVCLVVGLALGYLFRGSETRPEAAASMSATAGLQAPAKSTPQQRPTMAQMKEMADTKAAPLLAKLKADPRNVSLLAQVASLYAAAHQFRDAADYYSRVVEAEPKNVPIRIEMASCLYYAGDVDGALGQLQQSLTYDPKNANALFNLGMIKWKGKNDAAGAIVVWQTLLKTNPTLDRKPVVEKMIAEAKLGNPAAPSQR